MQGRTRRSPIGRWGQLCVLATAMIATTGASLPVRHSPPTTLRIEVQVAPWETVRWTEPTHNKVLRNDIRIVKARPGDALVDTTLYRDGIWTGGPHRLSPLTLGAIVGPERCWVRMTRAGCCGLYSHMDAFPDSVLVSTGWRTFDTGSVDAGYYVRVRVVSDTPVRASPANDTLKIRSGWSREESRMADVLRASEVVGLFRLLRVEQGESGPVGDFPPNRLLTFFAEDVWIGSAIGRGDTVKAWVAGGEATDTTWTPEAHGTPMREGRPVVVFLSRRTRGFPDKWSFEPWAGYGLLDDSGTRVFCYPIRGELIDRFRRRVDWEAWQPRHPFESRVFGNVLGAGGAPLPGARVDLPEQNLSTVTDSTGWFEFIGVPIGLRLMRVTGACPAAAGIVEATDEYSDTLDVNVPCSPGSPRIGRH